MAANPPEPRVVTALREFKDDLLRREVGQMQEMARRWLQVEQALEAYIADLADEVHEMRNAGVTPTASQIYRLQRYRSLLAQTEAQFNRYAEWAAAEITRQQEQLARLAVEHSARAIQESMFPQIGVYFDRLPVEAIQNMIGLAGDGSPIGELLRLRMIRDGDGNPIPGVWDRLTASLIKGTGLGWNPRKTAREMRDALAGGLQKALVIARSEQLRVYRYAAWEQYQRSGLVEGQRRLTAHDDRVCPACLADEGHIYYGPIPDHPNGRCTGVPVVKGMSPVRWTQGEDWFKRQDEAVQAAILGRDRLAAYQEGAFDFAALVTPTYNATWGAGLTPTPLSQLVQ